MSSHFFAFISRMKYINRWGLMRNTRDENISEHSLEVSMISHALCVIANTYYGAALDANLAAAAALYHDSSETITGDMPAPIKYFNPQISRAYKDIESVAEEKLLSLLPLELIDEYRKLMTPDKEIAARIKWADKISAYIKCVEEKKAGNLEFDHAAKTIYDTIMQIDAPEVTFFMERFMPSYFLSIDEQG